MKSRDKPNSCCKHITNRFSFTFNADIDECESDELNECDSNAICTNVEGFFICRCLKGYEGDGRFCAGKITILTTELSLLLTG